MESMSQAASEGRKWMPAWGTGSRTGISENLPSLRHHRGNLKAAIHVSLLQEAGQEGTSHLDPEIFSAMLFCAQSSVPILHPVYPVSFPIELH